MESGEILEIWHKKLSTSPKQLKILLAIAPACYMGTT